MATKPKPPCETIFRWLEANLGRHCGLAGLTYTDVRALKAAIMIMELYAYTGSRETAKAFGLVVGQMQESMREFAYHGIAHVCDWGTRAEVWAKAGLPSLGRVRICKYDSHAMRMWREKVAAEKAARKAAAKAALAELRRANDEANAGASPAAPDQQTSGQVACVTSNGGAA